MRLTAGLVLTTGPFNVLCDRLVAKHSFLLTRCHVGILPGTPLAIPTERLTMRTLRHTYVTLYFNADVPPHLIGSITGHSQDEVNEILAFYVVRSTSPFTFTWAKLTVTVGLLISTTSNSPPCGRGARSRARARAARRRGRPAGGWRRSPGSPQ